MVTIIPDTASDYLYVDGTEAVTLSDGTNSIAVATAKRSRIEATNQVSGLQVGDVLWDLAFAEVVGDIDKPLETMTITDANGKVYVIIAVRTLVISQIWQCACRTGV